MQKKKREHDDIENILDVFYRYTAGFLNGTKNLPVQLKIDHSLRVLNNSCQIVEQESFPKALHTGVKTAALFHDIGRFEQYRQYSTFNDSKSVNHGHLGVKVLKTTGMADLIDPAWKNMVLACVGLHNKMTLPAQMPQTLSTLCRVIQDSDKIDIFSVMLHYLEHPEKADSTVILDLVPHPVKCTPKLVQDVLANKLCTYSEMRWSNDFLLLLASWIPSFHFFSSLQILQQCGSVNKLCRMLPKTDAVDPVHQLLNRYCA